MTSQAVSRSTIWKVLLASMLCVAVAWSYWHRFATENIHTDTAQRLADCRSMAKRILRLQQQKQRALLQTKPSEELNVKVDNWARLAGVEVQNIVRIQPRSPQRIGDSQYLRQVTEVEFFQVLLPELMQFVHLAEERGEGLKLTSFRILPPRTGATEEAPEKWTAELELTYLIYSPKS